MNQKTIDKQGVITICENPNIFIGGIHPSISPSDLFNYLGRYSRVKSFEMPMDFKTGGWKGYAKACLESDLGVKALLFHKVHKIKGHEIGIKPWIDKSDYLKSKDEQSKRKLFVKFQPIVSSQDLFLHFSKFGPIESIDCKVDPLTGEPRNFAYIVFENEEDAHNAANFGECSLGSPKIWCELTKPKYIMDMEDNNKMALKHDEKVMPAYFGAGHYYDYSIPGEQPSKMHYSNKEFEQSAGLYRRKKQLSVRGNIIPRMQDNFLSGNQSQEMYLMKEKPINPNKKLHYGNNSKSRFARPGLSHNQGFKEFSPQLKVELDPASSFLMHRSKPTSKNYFAGARSQISTNHFMADNVCFRLVSPASLFAPT